MKNYYCECTIKCITDDHEYNETFSFTFKSNRFRLKHKIEGKAINMFLDEFNVDIPIYEASIVMDYYITSDDARP